MLLLPETVKLALAGIRSGGKEGRAYKLLRKFALNSSTAWGRTTNGMNYLKCAQVILIVTLAPGASVSQDLKHMNDTGFRGNIDPEILASGSRFQNAVDLNANQNIRVIELRNYVLKPGRRDEFIQLFEDNFTRSQNILGGYTLGQYRVKGADDHFFWIRGFKDMPARKKFLDDFYYGSLAWKQHKSEANSMLLNNDNVHLLKPLNLKDTPGAGEFSFSSDWFGQEKGIAVVDFYTSNTKLEKLIQFVKQKYSPILKSAKIANTSFWTSEMTPNDFPGLPVFQDKNLLVQITFYKNESEYQTKMRDVASRMDEELQSEMADLVTIKATLIIYPTEKSFRLQKQ